MTTAYRDFIFKFGLIVGVLQIVNTLLAYILGIEAMVSYTFGFIHIGIIIAGTVFCGLKWRKLSNGYITLRDAFMVMFLVYAASAFIALLFNLTLYHAIDPELPKQIQKAVVDKTIGTMEKWGAPEESIEEALAKFEENEGEYTIWSFITGYFWSLILGSAIALVTAVFIKKPKPPFEEIST